MQTKEKAPMSFQNFKLRVNRTPTSQRSYQKFSARDFVSVRGYTLEEIESAIKQGDAADLREISMFFMRTSGVYRSVIDYYANLLLYFTVVTPIFDFKKKINKDKLVKTYDRACEFIEDLNVPVNFSRILREMLISGIYYGILREEDGVNGKVTIQDLPISYCRTRFKTSSNLNIPEFNVMYFLTIKDEDERNEAISNYPTIVRRHWKRWRRGEELSPWVEIPPALGGLCFYYGDKTPLFVATIPDIVKYNDAVDRQAERDENELYKLLIQRMPVDSKGELVFKLEEIADIHDSVGAMLQNVDTVDVLTTFGETSLESLQDSTASAQSQNRITKYKQSTYDAFGVTSLLFNASGSASVPYSMSKDEALVIGLSNLFQAWIGEQLNYRYARTNLEFDFVILPITVNNKQKIQGQYFRGAQYGYSKIYAGVALGIKQRNLTSLVTFENDYLNLTETMIPLMSSYTSNTSAGASSKSPESDDKKVGRPELSTEEKSAKTIQNEQVNT